ncbi:MAG: Type 1 glutamine amidotransferase-like domain-containing protein [Anaerolineales bacterium]|uniref:Type 1 glutamine amidotransferase-like domain-containing protein n=1 Tax=Candidatus Villigracilis vicinus TaxID=3140679 RepID=UPI003134A585|nr:Type 1 glutamine amidotransferase-like domain-containing protein [Anaerolineales bacterium]MBK9780641.1 Type 1 glutamine amidotransferase-like domain-containing protein [Anaerolineales bacterium]
MPANLHLFSSPGERDLDDIVDACRPYVEGKEEPTIAYLPLASLYAERWLEMTEDAFKGLAELKTINTELMTPKAIESIIRDAQVVYVPGGNTFLLNHRLHASGVMPFLQKRIQAGLPYVGFSAGAILCGPNILTSKDLNAVSTAFFKGLNAIPFNVSPHYPLDGYGQSVKDDWLADYHFFHDNPVIIMCDGAYVKTEKGKTTLVRGEAYVLRKDSEKERLEEGQQIAL